DARQVFEPSAIDRTLVAGDANSRSRGAGHRMRAEPNFLDHVYNCVHFPRSSAGFHDNQHMVTSLGLFSLVQTPDLSLERKRETQRPVEKRSLSIATTRAPTKKQAACY